MNPAIDLANFHHATTAIAPTINFFFWLMQNQYLGFHNFLQSKTYVFNFCKINTWTSKNSQFGAFVILLVKTNGGELLTLTSWHVASVCHISQSKNIMWLANATWQSISFFKFKSQFGKSWNFRHWFVITWKPKY